MKQRTVPIALTIAGSDSGGGAGIQADLKTFAALLVHGTCAITCLTAQNPAGVTGIQAARPDMVRAQIEAVFSELHPVAVKTGMLFSKEIVNAVAGHFRGDRHANLVVDPVMVATSGARLLQNAAIQAIQKKLFPLAGLVTPNLHEAEILLDETLEDVEALRHAAREIHGRYGCATLVKGGHLKGMKDAVDIFYDGNEELLLSVPFIKGVSTHGTGCTYSAAIVAFLALGHPMIQAVSHAKGYITEAIRQSYPVGNHQALNHSWQTKP